MYTSNCQELYAYCDYYTSKGSYNNYKNIVWGGVDHVTGTVTAYMSTTPTSSDVNYAYAFSEHWPGGSLSVDQDIAYNGSKAKVYNSAT